ncbi:helix-turn-helix transcriptional regulator [Brevibacterium samyangense]
MPNSPTALTPSVVDEHAAAEYIGVSVGWLRNNRRSAVTPPFLKYGGKLVRYRVADLDRWIDAQLVTA